MKQAKLRTAILPALVGTALFLSACGGREEARSAALELAERLYPGELEVLTSQLQKNYYAVTFAVKGDPVTRIRLHMTSDMMDCAAGAPCEDRFRAAYEAGIARGIEIKAIDSAFHACGKPALAVQSYTDGPGLIPIIETSLTDANEASLIRQLTDCAKRYATELEAHGRTPEANTLALRLMRTDSGNTAPIPHTLSFEDSAPSRLDTAPSYVMSFTYAGGEPAPSALTFSPLFRLRQDMADEATLAIRQMKEAEDLTLPPQAFLVRTSLDPARVGLVHAYMAACSQDAMRKDRPCQSPDTAIRTRHDFDTGEVTAHDILRKDGLSDLPPLPSREGAEQTD